MDPDPKSHFLGLRAETESVCAGETRPGSDFWESLTPAQACGDTVGEGAQGAGGGVGWGGQ